MTQALHTAPVCEKHGCEKVWQKNKAQSTGGQWKCSRCQKIYLNSWKQANYKQVLADNNAWAQANPVKVSNRKSTWKKANPKAVKASDDRRRARKHDATVLGQPVTAAVIAERLALFDGCAYCNADKTLTVDHFVALNDGGLHVASNLVGACRRCNCSKRDNPVEEWFKSQPFFSVERWERLNEIT